MNSKRTLSIYFISSLTFFVFSIGFLTREFELFPYPIYVEAQKGWMQIQAHFKKKLSKWYVRIGNRHQNFNTNQSYEGLTLVTSIGANDRISAKVINPEGEAIHEWDINWFDIWPDADHIPEFLRPKQNPGVQIHGAEVTQDGGLIFNFEFLGLVHIDRDSQVVWRLPYMTHHSIHRHDDGNFWVGGRKYHTEPDPRLPHIKPPFFEDTVIEVNPDGEIVREWIIADILKENGYGGYLYMNAFGARKLSGYEERFSGDIFHLNDVEPFPSKLEADFYEPGDVMISLRDINSIVVFNSETSKVKTLITGDFIQQHDPDFIDGSTITIFDNNHSKARPKKSRIIQLSTGEKETKVIFEGTDEGTKDQRFYNHIMGKHQWLPNGNILITDSMSGRGFEVNKKGEIVWQYVNYVEKGTVGIVSEVRRLPVEYNKVFNSKI